jgi:hypothetical protein
MSPHLRASAEHEHVHHVLEAGPSSVERLLDAVHRALGLILEISGHVLLGIIQTARSFLRTDAGLLDDATPDFDFRPEKCADTLGSVGPTLVTERR